MEWEESTFESNGGKIKRVYLMVTVNVFLVY